MIYIKISNEWYHQDMKIPAGVWRIADLAFSGKDLRCIRIAGTMVTHPQNISELIGECGITNAVMSSRPLSDYYDKIGLPLR